MTSSHDSHQAQIAAWTNAIANVVLTVGKGVIGVVAGSQALIADAVHSAADVIGSLAVVVGLRVARKPPDEDHPYGHGKAELIAASIVAGFLVAAGLEVAYSSVKDLFHGSTGPRFSAAFTAFVAMVLKEILYHYNFRLGRRLHSKSLMASAYDHRSDVYSSLAALIGICLALLGKHLHVHWLLYMDAVAGLFVALLVLKMAYKIAKDSLQTLMDRVVLEEKDLNRYTESIAHIPGVRRIDDMRVRDHGQYVIVDVEIGVDAHISVDAGHHVATEVRRKMVERFARVQDVFVHVNPYYEGKAGGIEQPNGRTMESDTGR